MNNFSDLGLSSQLLKGLPELGINEPTDIQRDAIPILINGQQDFIGLAQTGTGKTAAFGLPLIDLIDPNQKHTQALVLAPTRELGQQIGQQLSAFGKYLGQIEIQTVYGGAAITNQMRDIKRKNPHIVIATPGRLIDLVKRKAIKLDQIRFLVLDEADEMLNMGFKEDIDFILEYAPKETATWLFSATMPKEIRKIVKNYMTDPKEVTVNSQNIVNVNITHKFVQIKGRDKTEALTRFIELEPDMKCVVFCRTKSDTQKVAEDLKRQGHRAEALNGDLTQKQRDFVMNGFKKHATNILVATDVAARGIDVNDLTHVIHYALPDDFAFYTHRSGRTARAGKKGISLVLSTKSDLSKIKQLERKLEINFERIEVPNSAAIGSLRIQKWANGIMQMNPIEIPKAITEEVSGVFADLSKEQLIEKLIVSELSKLSGGNVGDRDLNDSGAGRPERGERRERDGNRNERRKSERGERPERGERRESRNDRPSKGADGNQRFFINIGEIDGMNSDSLTSYIMNETNLRKLDISNVSVLEKHAYFSVDEKFSIKVNALKGKQIDGRDIRVNRDADGPTRPKKERRSQGGGRRSDGPSGRSQRGRRSR